MFVALINTRRRLNDSFAWTFSANRMIVSLQLASTYIIFSPCNLLIEMMLLTVNN